MLVKKQYPAKYLKYLLVFIFYIVFTFLFYRQAIAYKGRYPSDLVEHLAFGVNNSTYSLLITIIGAILKHTGMYILVALFESTVVILTFLLAEKYIRNYFGIDEIWAILISAGMLFLTSVYFPCPGFHFYQTSLMAQPWHNITYTGMRLLCIPVFFKTLEVIEQYQEHFAWKDWLILALPLVVCTMIKPNFLIDYSFTLLIVLIIDFLKSVSNKTLNKASFMRYIYLGTVVFPAIFVLIYQGKTIYVDQNSVSDPSGIALVFWHSPFFNGGKKLAAFKIVRDTLFPAVLALYFWKRFSKKDKFVFLFFVVTLIQVILLTETGPRAAHGNFGWGILAAGYFLYMYVISVFVRYVSASPLKNRTTTEKCFVAFGGGFLLWHVLSAMLYFAILLIGGPYYI